MGSTGGNDVTESMQTTGAVEGSHSSRLYSIMYLVYIETMGTTGGNDTTESMQTTGAVEGSHASRLV